MALCTQADVEALLQVTFGANPDATVTRLIADAQAEIESLAGRTFESASHTETLEGKESMSLFLASPPVTALASVVENGVTLVDGTDYLWYADGRLSRKGSSGNWHPQDWPFWQWSGWSTLPRSVVVTYTGGYATVPADIRDVCAQVTAELFGRGVSFGTTTAGDVASATLGNFSISYANAGQRKALFDSVLTPDQRETVLSYRNVVLA